MKETIPIILEAIGEAALDCLKILPILYLTYLLLEYIENRAGGKVETALRHAGGAGPFFGALFGLIPQCGFSSAAASFFATRTITAGSLIAVFLATSDEMLPILLSAKVAGTTILLILGIKLVSGTLVGFLTDFLWYRGKHRQASDASTCACEHDDDNDDGDGDGHEHDAHDHAHGEHAEIHELCERAHCHCDEGQNIFLSALTHTLWIAGLILAVSAALGVAFALVGEDRLSVLFTSRHFLGELVAALVGLIPNCGASVLITDLYVKNVIGIGPLLSGLLVNAGVGLLVLLRTNRHKDEPARSAARVENLKIVVILLISGLVIGTLAGYVAGVLL